MADKVEPLDLDAIRKRCEAATPGPWETWSVSGGEVKVLCGVEERTSCSRSYRDGGHEICSTDSMDYDQDGISVDEDEALAKATADAEFIASARQDVPTLLDEVERLRAQNANLRGAMDAQDHREKAAGEVCGIPYEEHGCDWPEVVADKIVFLKSEVDRLRACVASVHREIDGLDDYHTVEAGFVRDALKVEA
jgi:hypothetical protein